MNEDALEQAPSQLPIFHRDRAEYWAFIAQIVSAVAVVLSLVFVGIQLRDGNRVALRNESNATMAQWSSFRTSIYGDRDTAQLFAVGMNGEDALGPADQLRFLYLMREHAWATFQIWDRNQNGLLTTIQFRNGAAPDFLRVICTPGGVHAWAQIKTELPSPFVDEIDRQGAVFAEVNGVHCIP
ncbi:MAG: hypothetical protein U0995_09190 [Erythrobacter sp.]|nr:hypothetical protein [Erythrobacter sp.]MDZ4276201.1 hypothetical protein [Erythrobacter sp.]